MYGQNYTLYVRYEQIFVTTTYYNHSSALYIERDERSLKEIQWAPLLQIELKSHILDDPNAIPMGDVGLV